MPQITFDLDDDSYDKLTQLVEKKGRTIEDSLPEILFEPISRHYFSEFTASIDYFEGRSPVTDEEAEVARRFVLSQITASAIPLPCPEAVIYGLCLAAHDLALKLCEDARYKYPDQHADSLADEIFRQVQDILFRAAAKTAEEESEKLAQQLGIRSPDSDND
jgi:hypothetical protein